MSGVLLVGVFAWGLVLLNYLVAFKRRRSQVRITFVLTALGTPTWFLRELGLIRRGVALNVLVVLGVCAGVFCAFLLVSRWVNDPRVLD